jgi:hypothetical protein
MKTQVLNNDISTIHIVDNIKGVGAFCLESTAYQFAYSLLKTDNSEHETDPLIAILAEGVYPS